MLPVITTIIPGQAASASASIGRLAETIRLILVIVLGSIPYQSSRGIQTLRLVVHIP